MDLKILAWNVEHFKSPKSDFRKLTSPSAKNQALSDRVDRVVTEITAIPPDIFAILETVVDLRKALVNWTDPGKDSAASAPPGRGPRYLGLN